MNPQTIALVSQLNAEREHASKIWTILNELRNAGLLPDWAKALDAGTMRQVEEQERARRQVDVSLAHLIPGFEQAARREQPSGSLANLEQHVSQALAAQPAKE